MKICGWAKEFLTNVLKSKIMLEQLFALQNDCISGADEL